MRSHKPGQEDEMSVTKCVSCGKEIDKNDPEFDAWKLMRVDETFDGNICYYQCVKCQEAAEKLSQDAAREDARLSRIFEEID